MSTIEQPRTDNESAAVTANSTVIRDGSGQGGASGATAKPDPKPSGGKKLKPRAGGKRGAAMQAAAAKPKAAATTDGDEKPLTVKAAVAKVLGNARNPLETKVVVERVLAMKLPSLKGKTPAATIAAELAVGAKPENGRYVRTAPGTFKLKR